MNWRETCCICFKSPALVHSFDTSSTCVCLWHVDGWTVKFSFFCFWPIFHLCSNWNCFTNFRTKFTTFRAIVFVKKSYNTRRLRQRCCFRRQKKKFRPESDSGRISLRIWSTRQINLNLIYLKPSVPFVTSVEPDFERIGQKMIKNLRDMWRVQEQH